MERQTKIKLGIPTIDLSLLKKIRGGYMLYGGELDPAYCIADRAVDSYPDADGGETPDFNIGDPDDFTDHDFVKDEIESQHENGRPDNDFTSNPEKLSPDMPLTPELVSRLLAGKEIGFMFDQSFLDNKSKHPGAAQGCVIFEGQKLPDGTIAEHDTIILGESATMSTINEELFHIWQGKNCFTGDGKPNEKEMPKELMFLLSGLVSLDGHQFDFDGFIEKWDDSLFERWKEMYVEHPYGQGTDNDWQWNWSKAYDWWKGIWEQRVMR